MHHFQLPEEGRGTVERWTKKGGALDSGGVLDLVAAASRSRDQATRVFSLTSQGMEASHGERVGLPLSLGPPNALVDRPGKI